MAGLSALQSKLSKLNKTSHPLRKKKISVIHMNEDGTVDYPENCNTGVLLVPAEMSEVEWELQNAIDDQREDPLCFPNLVDNANISIILTLLVI